jgi:putative tricarboxylic transport membrane protein
MIAVRKDSPYKNLRELINALRKQPARFSIGAGGTVGSQDWLKMAQIARIADIDPKALKLVAFEGGGESFTALLANHVQIVSGDVSEAVCMPSRRHPGTGGTGRFPLTGCAGTYPDCVSRAMT